MTSSDFIIREIEPKDNEQMADVVREVILEMGAPKTGTAYEDKALDNLHATYQKEKAIYYVIEHQNKVVGGGGVAQLDNFDGNTCELQKMYFKPIARGRGLGSAMITKCLQKAKEFGFDECYLETMPYMTAARALYKKNGFTQIDGPMGDTCHYSCDVWMIKKL
ncbi:GNAT family N-acetyltransferase [Pseudotenacibaculum sp. MALMAid0570]|uniref:GNAT family N-acetyltransferase n=1 Tax=Pseudotenacibaculum sp. MALMAid0570 TaxID=3143938 RepID=UPI0032DE9F52